MQVVLTATDWLLATPLLFLTGAAVLLLLWDTIRPSQERNLWIALLGLAAAMTSLAPILRESRVEGSLLGFSDMLRVDSLGATLSMLCLGAAVCCGLLAWGNLLKYEKGRHDTAFWCLLLIVPIGMLLTIWADHMVMLFLGIETLSLPLYVLAALRRGESTSIEAGLKYFLLGAFASGFLAFGMALLYAATGSLSTDAVKLALEFGPQATLGLGMVLIGLLFKAASIPFHLWVADVYQGAPTPVTAFMATGVKAAAVAALLRWAPSFELFTADAWALLGTLTLLLANFAALNQTNLKRLLALSGVAHVGILLFAFAARAALGTESRIDETLGFYLMAYGLTALAGFGGLELLERHSGGTSDSLQLRGLARRHPIAAAALCISILSLAGVPLTAGFLAKYFVFVELIRGDMLMWALVGVLLTLISFAYYLRALVTLFMVDAESAEEEADVEVATRAEASPVDPVAAIAVVVPAILTVLFGLWPTPLQIG